MSRDLWLISLKQTYLRLYRSPVISSLSNLSSLTQGSTCLQRLHLFEWIHLLPQPIQLGLHIIFLRSCISTKRQEKNTGQMTNGGSQVIFTMCVPCVRGYLRPAEVSRPSWCGMDGWSWSGAGRSRGRGRQGGPDVPCLSPVDPTGRDTVAHLVLLWEEPKNSACGSIYTGPLCTSLGALPTLAPTLFVFVQTSGGGERGIRVEWQIMTSLCLAFW